jgi:hypothetical membrane protein
MALLPLFAPGYDSASQPISQLGQLGAPLRIPFAAVLIVTAILQLLFSFELRSRAKAAGASQAAFYLIVVASLCAIGGAIFPTPLPLHKLFGWGIVIGYFAPFALAIGWRRFPGTRLVIGASVLFGTISLTATVLAFSPLYSAALGEAIQPVYGLVQRAIHFGWYGWLAATGLLLLGKLESERSESVQPN